MTVTMLLPVMAGMFVFVRTVLTGMLVLVGLGPLRVLVRVVVPVGMAMAVQMTMLVGMGRLAVVMRMAVAMLVFVAVLVGVFVISFHNASSLVSQNASPFPITLYNSVKKATNHRKKRRGRHVLPMQRLLPGRQATTASSRPLSPGNTKK